jgi:hypothetical protein
MRTNKKLGKPLAVRLTAEMHEALEREANTRQVRVPDLVRWILSEHLTGGLGYTIQVQGQVENNAHWPTTLDCNTQEE